MIEALIMLPFVVVVTVCAMMGTLWVLEKAAKSTLWLLWQVNKALGSRDARDPFK